MATRTWTGAAGDGKFSTVGNWAEGYVPGTGDDVWFADGDKDLNDALDQSAIRLAGLHVTQAYLGLIGTAAAYLKIGAAVVEIGAHYGPGSPGGSQRLKLDLQHFDQEAGPVVTVLNSSPVSADLYRPPVRLLLNDADAKLYVRRGLVGVAVERPSETSLLQEIHVSFADSVEADADLVLGPGVNWTSLYKTGGRVVVQSGGTTIANAGGTLYVVGQGDIVTLTVLGGRVYAEALGTITLLECRGGVVDFLRSRRARTVTEAKVWRGATLRYDPAIVALGSPPQPQESLALSAQTP